MKFNKIACKPVTFGNGHNDPNSCIQQIQKRNKTRISHIKAILCKLSVTATIYLTKDRSARSDIDNYAKPIIDALHEAKAFISESQIYKLTLIKMEVNQPNEEGITIELCEIP
jgi:Holliday junction resolvase RusA-like endonuclease